MRSCLVELFGRVVCLSACLPAWLLHLPCLLVVRLVLRVWLVGWFGWLVGLVVCVAGWFGVLVCLLVWLFVRLLLWLVGCVLACIRGPLVGWLPVCLFVGLISLVRLCVC